MVTYIVLTTDEISKEEYIKLTVQKVHQASVGWSKGTPIEAAGPPDADLEVVYEGEAALVDTALSEVHMPPRQSKTPHYHGPTSINAPLARRQSRELGSEKDDLTRKLDKYEMDSNLLTPVAGGPPALPQ